MKSPCVWGLGTMEDIQVQKCMSTETMTDTCQARARSHNPTSFLGCLGNNIT